MVLKQLILINIDIMLFKMSQLISCLNRDCKVD